jgi:hypothetical protein
MMKWAKERDSLIAQTKAFVNSVIAWKADGAPPSEPVQPVAIENPFAARLWEELEQIGAIEQLGAEEETAEPAQALPMAELPSPGPAPAALASPDVAPLTPASVSNTPQEADPLQKEDSMQNDVRKEIQSRVAAFQAHQHRFAREREAYFNSVLIKVRSSLDGTHDEGDREEPSA